MLENTFKPVGLVFCEAKRVLLAGWEHSIPYIGMPLASVKLLFALLSHCYHAATFPVAEYTNISL